MKRRGRRRAVRTRFIAVATLIYRSPSIVFPVKSARHTCDRLPYPDCSQRQSTVLFARPLPGPRSSLHPIPSTALRISTQLTERQPCSDLWASRSPRLCASRPPLWAGSSPSQAGMSTKWATGKSVSSMTTSVRFSHTFFIREARTKIYLQSLPLVVEERDDVQRVSVAHLSRVRTSMANHLQWSTYT